MTGHSMVQIVGVETGQQLATIRLLFSEYADSWGLTWASRTLAGTGDAPGQLFGPGRPAFAWYVRWPTCRLCCPALP